MPQANRKNSTTALKLNELGAISLISAHRKASERLTAADIEYKKIAWPSLLHIAVPELGPSFSAHSLEALDRGAEMHIKNYGLGGLEQIKFLRRIEDYKTAFKLLEALDDGWRKQNHIDAIEDAYNQAYDGEEKAWKALLKRARSHPGEAPLIARYICSKEYSMSLAYRYIELLSAIASPSGKAART